MKNLIFMSYSSQDKKAVDKVVSYLESHKKRCWIAPRDIQPGADWAESIIDALDIANWMVLIVSEHSNKSPQVRREVERAVSKGIHIIPLIFDKSALSKWMQYYISAHQWFDVSETNLRIELPKLLEAIGAGIQDQESPVDLSDLSSLLEHDLDKLSLMLDVDEGETERLLPGDRRRVSALHIHTELNSEKLPLAASSTVYKTIDILIDRLLKAYGGYLDSRTKTDHSCVFGLEVALEDDTRRAVSCGISLFNSLKDINKLLGKNDISINYGLGIDLGILSVDGSNNEHIEASGVVLKKARELSLKASSEILASDKISRLTRDQFDWEDTEDGLKHIADYSVANTCRKQLTVNTQIFGRKPELEKLSSILKIQATSSDKNFRNTAKHLVLGISGEAGLGKSRLVQEFIATECLSEQKYLVLNGNTLSFAQPAYWLWTSMLSNLLDIEYGSKLSYNQFISKISSLVNVNDLENSLPFLAELLLIKSNDKRIALLDAKAVQLETKIAFRDLLKSLSSDKKLIIVLDDLHWIDESDKQVLEFIISNCDTATPILFFLLFRPEVAGLSSVEFDIHNGYAIAEELQLMDIDPEASTLLAAELIGGLTDERNCSLNSNLVKLLLVHSRGNPLYLEELIYNLHETQAIIKIDNAWSISQESSNIFIPDSLSGLLQSRLDRLPSEVRTVLQHSSVLGIEFQLKLLRKLREQLSLSTALGAHLDTLEKKKILSCNLSAFSRKYIFRHVLIRETSYNSILHNNRKLLHKAAANSLEGLFPEGDGRIAVVLSRHWEKAGSLPKAIYWSTLALERNQKSQQYSKALSIAKELDGFYNQYKPDDQLRAYTEFLINYGIVQTETGLWQDATSTFTKASSLAERLDAPDLVLECKANKLSISVKRGNFERIETECKEILNSGIIAYSDRINIMTRRNLGILYWQTGDLKNALRNFEQNKLYAEKKNDLIQKAISIGNIAMVFAKDGNIEKAIDLTSLKLRICNELTDLKEVGISLGNIGSYYAMSGDYGKAQSYFEKQLAIHTKSGHREGILTALANSANVLKHKGNFKAADNAYNKAIHMAKDIGKKDSLAHILGNYGDMLINSESWVKAKKTLEEALLYSELLSNSLLISRNQQRLSRLNNCFNAK